MHAYLLGRLVHVLSKIRGASGGLSIWTSEKTGRNKETHPESPRARDIEPRPYLRARAKNVLHWWMSVYMGRWKRIEEQAIRLEETDISTYSNI